MKKFLGFITLTAALLLPLSLTAQTYVAQSGVSFFTATLATATHTSSAVRLPTFSGAGTLTITESGVTGSPSGCTIALAYEGNNATVATSAVSTTSFTPGNSVQQFTVSPSPATGDNYVATYACSSAYPTAGLLTASFSPAITSTVASGAVSIVAAGSDPCANLSVPKSSVAINISTATTTQLVAVSASKAIYACSFAASVAGTAPTVLFEYGTSTACTGTNALSGTLAITTGSYVTLGWGGTIFTAPATNGLCLVSGGTLPSVQGVLTYVVQ
jgi:hypothetical protein